MANTSYLIKFGADATSVTKAINGVNTDMRTLRKVASNADKAFKLTGDTSQLDTKLQALQKMATLTGEKVETLQDKLDGLKGDNGELPETAQVKRLQNQLLSAQSDLSSFDAKMKAVENQKAGSNIGGDMDKATRAINTADNATGRLHSSLSKSGVALGSFVGNLAGNLVSSGIQAVAGIFSGMADDITSSSDSLQKFTQTMGFAGKSSKEIDKVTAASKKYADETVYDLGTVLNTTAQLGANGVDNYQQLVEAAGNLNAVVGGNADTFSSVSMVLTQTAGAGKLTTENWNQLADAIPGASGKLQDAMKQNGAYTGKFRDAMEDGEISAGEFNKAIQQLGMSDVAKEAATSTDTIEGAIGNLQASFTTAGVDILDKIKKPLTQAISFIADSVPQLQESLSGMVSGVNWDVVTEPFKQIGSAAMVGFKSVNLGPVLKQLKSVGASLSGLFSGLDLSGIQSLTANFLPALIDGFQQFMKSASPAIESVVSKFKDMWTALQPILNTVSQMLFPAFKILGSYLGGFFSGVLQTVGVLFDALAKVFEFIYPAVELVKNVFLKLAPAFSKVANWLGQLQGGFSATNKIMGVVGKIFGGVASGISNAFTSLKNSLSAGFGQISSGFRGVGSMFSKVGGGIGKVATRIIGWFKGIGGKIAGGFGNVKNLIGGKFKGIHGHIVNAFGNVKSIGLNVVKGIAAGITGGISYIKGVITDFVGNVTGFIKKVFKIKSPSKLMRDEVGTYITQGIGDGMTDRTAMGSIKGAVNSVSRGVMNGFGNLTTGGAMTASIAGVPSTSTTNSQLTFNISGSDPNRTAEAIRKVLRQEKLI